MAFKGFFQLKPFCESVVMFCDCERITKAMATENTQLDRVQEILQVDEHFGRKCIPDTHLFGFLG